MREGLPIEFAPTFPLQRLDNSQMPPRRSRRNAGQKPDPLEVEAGGKKEEEGMGRGRREGREGRKVHNGSALYLPPSYVRY